MEINEQETVAEFEAMFAADQSKPPEETPPDSTEAETTTEETTTPETEESDESDDDSSDETETETDDSTDTDAEESETPEQKKKRQENFAISKMRTERNKFEGLIRNLGKQLKLDPALSAEDMAAKIAELNVKQTAKELNIPIEVAEKLNQSDAIIAENAKNTRYIQVNSALDSMRKKYGFDDNVENDLIQALLNEGKNPLEVDVDLEGEYLKRNIDNIVKQQREDAANAERARKANAANASTPLPGSAPEAADTPKKINTVDGLNALFDQMIKDNKQ